MTYESEMKSRLCNDLDRELTTYLPHHYGMPSEFDSDEEFLQVWRQFQFDYIRETVDRLIATTELPEPGSERWGFMVHIATDEFDVFATSMERMSLTVPTYIPYLVRHLAEGPRQMGEAVTKLIVQAFVRKPEPQGILERIESRLNSMENRLQALDNTSAAKL